MGKKDESRASLFHSSNAVNIITIIVVTLVCIVLVLVLAKGLFASNSKDVPAGINTGTIANSSAAASVTTTTVTTAAEVSGTASAGSSETVSSVTTEARDDSVAYVVTYVQLKAQPNQDSANVVCMSPNIKVKILERREDGYVQLTFLNGDGSNCTGYVKTEYLSPTPVERTTPTETVTETEETDPSETTALPDAAQTTASSRSNNAFIETVAQ